MLAHAAAMRRDLIQQCHGTDLSRALTLSEIVSTDAANAAHNTLPNAAYRWCPKRRSIQEPTSDTPFHDVCCMCNGVSYCLAHGTDSRD